MNILEQHGLKSVTAHNLDTILSYEGMVCTPMNLQIGPYDKSLKGHPYTAQVQFAPIAFPDQWESLKQKLKIKKIFNDFILLFK
ncbi:MAG: hypothetical protein HUK40_18590 [Desulfobacter sp.]|nr:hypothetical protein [Desulfobacter sp.]